MPRVSNNRYLCRHDFLAELWVDGPQLFRVLTLIQQRHLHRYYRPAWAMSTAQLLAHRRQLDHDTPSLGARAGKSFLKLWWIFETVYDCYGLEAITDGWAIPDYLARCRLGPTTVITPTPGSELRLLSISAVVRPEPDLRRLARALLGLAGQLAQRKVVQDKPQAEVA